MSSFHIGKTHIFTYRNPDTEPNIYLKAGAGETLIVQATATNAQTADYATTAGTATNAETADYATTSGTATTAATATTAIKAESIEKTTAITSVLMTGTGLIEDSGPTGSNPYRGCSVSVNNNDLFITQPNDTRNSKRGTISYFTRSGGTWNYQGFITPPAVLPGCGVVSSYWGYSIAHRGSLMCVSSPDLPLSETGVAIYRKVAGTWTHQSSTNCGGSHCTTDGTYVAGWFANSPLTTEVDICNIDGSFNKTIIAPADVRQCSIHNGEIAVSSSTGVLGIYNIGSGALVSSYSADNVFGYLVVINATYIVSVGLDKRSIVVIKRSDSTYYTSLKLTSDIKFIKLEGNILCICYADLMRFYYNNGATFFYSGLAFTFTRSDDTVPYPSVPVWPNILDYDMTNGHFVIGFPTLEAVSGFDISEGSRSTLLGSVSFSNTALNASIQDRKMEIVDSSMNPLSAATAPFYSKGVGCEKLYTGFSKITNTTAATSTTSGSIINAGGLGNNGRIYTTDLTCVNSIVGKNSYCIVYKNSGTNIVSGVANPLLFTSPTVVKNTTDITVNANGEITVGEAGTYLLTGSCKFQNQSAGYREIFFGLTSGTYLGLSDCGATSAPAVQGEDHYLTSSMMIYLTAGTKITLYLYQDSGSTLSCVGHMSVCRLVS